MPRDPILTIGDLEPERATVQVNRTAPDGWWQRFKFRHFDVLLRWFPVRFTYESDAYPLRSPSEFGLRGLQRLRVAQEEIRSLQGRSDPATLKRISRALREMSGMVLDAPSDVLDSLTPAQHLQVLAVFPQAVTGPRTTPPTESPPTSDDSSPDSATSTLPTAMSTG